MDELIGAIFEGIFELLLISRRTAPWTIALILLVLFGFGVYWFIGG